MEEGAVYQSSHDLYQLKYYEYSISHCRTAIQSNEMTFTLHKAALASEG